VRPDNVVSVLVELGHGVAPVRRLLMLPERAPAEHQRRVGGVRRRCTRGHIIARGSEVHGLGEDTLTCISAAKGCFSRANE
jgi:hypothetical protein